MLEKAMISGVTHTLEESVFRARDVNSAELLARLAGCHVNVDTILHCEQSEIVFSVPSDDRRDVIGVLDDLQAQWEVRDDLGKVSLVGAGMKTHPGVAAIAFAVLAEEGIDAVLVSTSPIKVAWHLPAEHVARATRALHVRFRLDSPDSVRDHP
jgi:aspartate kinase